MELGAATYMHDAGLAALARVIAGHAALTVLTIAGPVYHWDERPVTDHDALVVFCFNCYYLLLIVFYLLVYMFFLLL